MEMLCFVAVCGAAVVVLRGAAVRMTVVEDDLIEHHEELRNELAIAERRKRQPQPGQGYG